MKVDRICKPGFKNCKMPELRKRIAKLEREIRDNMFLVEGVKQLKQDNTQLQFALEQSEAQISDYLLWCNGEKK